MAEPRSGRAAHQQLTREWWDQRETFELFVSGLVLKECQAGDPTAAADRIAALMNLPVLEQTDGVTTLAERILSEVPIPAKAASDAFHIAHAAMHRMKYLLTSNCRHIANAVFRHPIVKACKAVGVHAPLICTPLELLPVELQPKAPDHE
jgi:predicted nucleic acid-binding protein